MGFEGRAGYSVYMVRCKDSCLKDRERGFPGGAVVNTLPFHVGGVGTTLGWKTKILYAMQPKTKKKKEKAGKSVTKDTKT